MNEMVMLNCLNVDERKVFSYNGHQKEELYSVEEAVNATGYGKFQIRVLILAGLGWFADAAEIFILSVIGDFIACDWLLYRWQIALLTSVVFVGIMFGSTFFGFVADRYGRKRAFSIAIVSVFCFGCASAASPNYTWMIIFRTCMGFVLSGVGQSFTLCVEYCPPNMRGKACFYLCYFWSFGAVVVILMTWVVMKYLDSWRILLVAAAMPALLSILTLKIYPESARYYLVSNQYKRATNILQKIATENGTDLPPGRLGELTKSPKRGSFRELLGSEYRLTTLLHWYIWLALAFGYYGVCFVSPTIIQQGNLIVSVQNNTGNQSMGSIVPCAVFSQQFYIDLLWTSASEFPGIIVFTILVERLSRKTLLMSACFISSILVLLLLLNTHKIVILLFLFGARATIGAVYQLIYIMTTEAFPTTSRALALGSASSFARLGGIVVPYVAQVLVIDSPIAAISLIAGILFLSGIAGGFLPIETRGIQMKDVTQQLK